MFGIHPPPIDGMRYGGQVSMPQPPVSALCSTYQAARPCIHTPAASKLLSDWRPSPVAGEPFTSYPLYHNLSTPKGYPYPRPHPPRSIIPKEKFHKTTLGDEGRRRRKGREAPGAHGLPTLAPQRHCHNFPCFAPQRHLPTLPTSHPRGNVTTLPAT